MSTTADSVVAVDELAEKWVKKWEEAELFNADPRPDKEKIFVTFPFAYMNGPLHVGHAFSATRVDVYARFKRMQGYNVLFPWAWHWTGQPVVSAAQKIREGDERQRKIFVEMDGVPEEEVDRFVDPVYLASYYTRLNRDLVRRIGFSIDWRREFHTTSHEPLFSRFVEWQCVKLREAGYVVQGTHPVAWCPKDKSPTQDHDRLEGEGVSPEQYTLVKFRLDDATLVAATFRPETLPGATNVWVNPEGTYVKAEVDGEDWIVSREAAAKLSEQLRNVTVKRELKGSELLGRYCKAPVTGREVPVLPALFVGMSVATGVVYSVPAHAPYDWLALRDLKSGDARLKYGIPAKTLSSVEPISIISLPGFGEFPAVEAVDRLKVTDQLDRKGEAATKEIYTKEFHQGRMKQNCLKYSGMTVSQAKEAAVLDLKENGDGGSFYDLPDAVICRCGTRCIVKILQGQWFLTYNDETWKERSLAAIERAKVMPAEARQWFVETVRWLREWPCARKTGLGTPLPWDAEWLVETLSDSTIYMAFYTIVHILRAEGVRPEQLTVEVFDYVFLGRGEAGELSRRAGVKEGLLGRLRAEFLYWYPVDLRNSGKDLVANHLTFFVMQHVALFPEEHAPRGLGVNGMIQLEGARMSKSHGNFVAAKQAVDSYGPDATRATLLASAEGMDDPDWRAKNALDMKEKLNSMLDMMTKFLASSADRPEASLDRWLLSVMQQRIRDTGRALEELKTRTAFQSAFFSTWNDLRWYVRRTKPRRETLLEFFRTWLLLLAPFTPFVAEEMNERLGGRGFVSAAPWPRDGQERVDPRAELAESLVQGVVEDIKRIKDVVRDTVGSAEIYVADGSMSRLLEDVHAELGSGKRDGEVIREVLAKAAQKDRQGLAGTVQAIIKYSRDAGQQTMSKIVSNRLDEASVLTEALEFICGETGLSSAVVRTEGGGVKKGRVPLPMKPVIVLS
ncbi:MAG: leucine--tRNA ligase [Nitrososphaerota archaeon]|nr:leucine--tRNA ligase [Nitrososphaerota archaeon]